MSAELQRQLPSVEELQRRLGCVKVLPVLRSPSVETALDDIRRCAEAGLDVVELTTTTPGWYRALAEALARFPGLLIGVGTVLAEADAERAVAGGADFVVSPCPAPGVRRTVEGTVPFIEGGMTVGEVLSASRHGIAKLFPAHVGGPEFLRSVLSIEPRAIVVPTGGIALQEVPSWLAAGALAVGIGRKLFSEEDLSRAVRTYTQGDGDEQE